MIGLLDREPAYRVIPTTVHGALDYSAGTALAILPHLVKVGATASWVSYAGAILAFGYAVLTRYELGLVPALPMKGHLAIDFLYGAAFVGAAFFLKREPLVYRAVIGAVGVTGLLASVLTRHQPARTSLIRRS